jgi:hypothetical protein
MTSPVIEVRGLKELQERMQKFPEKLTASLRTTMIAALTALWENVPPYPPPPEYSTYVRTGTLGRSLGSSIDGGTGGQPSIFQVREMGSSVTGRFGTNLSYAPHVIGDETQSPRMSHWWTIRTVAEKAQEKIDKLFNTLADKLADFLDKGI